jgi:hypothetical protein
VKKVAIQALMTAMPKILSESLNNYIPFAPIGGAILEFGVR